MNEKRRNPRDLDLYPLEPGEFPVKGDWCSGVMDESKHIQLGNYQNGQCGICHWSWPDDWEPLPPPRPNEQG